MVIISITSLRVYWKQFSWWSESTHRTPLHFSLLVCALSHSFTSVFRPQIPLEAIRRPGPTRIPKPKGFSCQKGTSGTAANPGPRSKGQPPGAPPVSGNEQHAHAAHNNNNNNPNLVNRRLWCHIMLKLSAYIILKVTCDNELNNRWHKREKNNHSRVKFCSLKNITVPLLPNLHLRCSEDSNTHQCFGSMCLMSPRCFICQKTLQKCKK